MLRFPSYFSVLSVVSVVKKLVSIKMRTTVCPESLHRGLDGIDGLLGEVFRGAVRPLGDLA